jgi:hypothetical protein
MVTGDATEEYMVVGDAVARYAEVGNTAVGYAGEICRRSRLQIWNIQQPTAQWQDTRWSAACE